MSKESLKEKIRQGTARYPKREYIKKLSLFGSFLHQQAGSDSDIDLLVTFNPDAPVGFFEFVRFQQFIEHHLGRKVDLVTEQGLSPYFRKEVAREAEVIYEN